MDKYTYKIWDKQSPVNGAPAEKVLEDLTKPWEQVYLIEYDGVVAYIQSESFCPYPAQTIEESARLHCDALNNPQNIEETEETESEITT